MGRRGSIEDQSRIGRVVAGSKSDKVGTGAAARNGSTRELFLAEVEGLVAQTPVVFLVGPAGIGKSTLLDTFAQRSASLRGAGAPVRLDCAELTPTVVLAEMQALLAAGREVHVDGWESVGGGDPMLARWLSSARMPTARVLVAGREPPSVVLLAASASGSVAVARVPPLSRGEAELILSARQVPVPFRAELASRADGNPLALHLLSTHRDDQEPLALSAIIDQFVGDLADGPEREALEVLAFLPYANEDALRAIAPDLPGSAFDWLRRQSYVRSSRAGLRVHEALGDALRRDLLWRRPDVVGALIGRILGGIATAVQASEGVPSLWGVHTLLFLAAVSRHASQSPLTFGRASVEPLTHALLPEAEVLVREVWGDASADLLPTWLAEGGVGVVTFDASGRLSALAVHLGPGWHPGQDPLLQRLREAFPGKPITVRRVCVLRGLGFVPCDEIASLQSWVTVHNWSLPPGTLSVTVIDDPEPWRDAMAGIGGELREDLAVRLGEHTFRPHVHTVAGAKTMAPLLISFVQAAWPDSAQPVVLEPARPPSRRALSAEEALGLLRHALPHLPDPLALGQTALATALGEDGPALSARLGRLIAETAAMRPAGTVRRVLEAAYDGRFGGQEAAAAACAMSLPSFKRYKRQGLERLAARLAADSSPSQPSVPGH